MLDRKASVKRETYETQIEMTLDIDGEGKVDIATGIGFLDHMLTLFAKHGLFDLEVKINGDLEVDSHHTIEDAGIVLGDCIKKALGTKEGIKRYGDITLPMDETLVLCALDISARPYLNFEADFTMPMLGEYASEMVEEFFRAVCVSAGINMHLKVLNGHNNHHMAEALHKAFGRTLDKATRIDKRVKGVPSTKGLL